MVKPRYDLHYPPVFRQTGLEYLEACADYFKLCTSAEVLIHNVWFRFDIAQVPGFWSDPGCKFMQDRFTDKFP